VVRQVQDARKRSGLDVSDRVALKWTAPTATAEAIAEHQSTIAAEVLAVEMGSLASPPPDGAEVFADDDTGLRFTIERAADLG
jgi:isoleucyl-tRNA synthetase